MKKLANYAVIGLILVALVALTSCPFGVNTSLNGSYYMKEGTTEYFGVYFDSQTSYTYYVINKGASAPKTANHFTKYSVKTDDSDSSVYYVQRPNPNAGQSAINVWKVNKDTWTKKIFNVETGSEYNKVSSSEFTAIFGNVGKSSWKYSDYKPVNN